MSQTEPTIAIIIPTYNERAQILSLLRAIRLILPQAALVVVDDTSPDGTARLIQAASNLDQYIHLVLNPSKGGRGAAVLAGFRWVLENLDATITIEMDADFSHQPQELLGLIKVAESGDVAIASRYLKGSQILGWPIRRHLFSRISNFLIRSVLGLRLQDTTNGFRAYPRKAAEQLAQQSLRCQSFMVLSEVALLLSKKGATFTEVPSTFINRRMGVSNTNVREITANFRELFQLWYRYRFMQE